MRITDRDIQIKEFLNNVVVADTNTLSVLFFNNGLRQTQRRLKILVENKYIKCFREDILSPYIFYSKTRPKNYKHKMYFSKLLKVLKENNIEVIKYKTPFVVANVIADGFICLNIKGEIKIFLVEVELSKYFNEDKYINLYYSKKWKESLPVFPTILVVTNKKIKSNEIKIHHIKLDQLH